MYLEGIWKPFLIYMQELFSPPISLTGFPSLSTMSPNEIKFYEVFIDTQVLYNYSTCPVLQTLKDIHPTFQYLMKPGFITTLTVNIPKDPRHSFWHPQVLRAPHKSEVQEKISFEVQRWGQTKQESYHHAAQRAADIIRYIRTAVLGDTPKMPTFQFTTLIRTPTSCGIFELGTDLCRLWKVQSETFSKHSKGKDASSLLQAIQEKYDSDAYLYARPLLQYYKVYLAIHPLTEIRLISKWNSNNLTTRPTHSQIYLFTYSVKLRNSRT
jgi:hypothetical protein